MDTATRLTPGRYPLGALAVGAAALAVFLVPALQSILIFDRVAIGQGELWRLVTGHLVHFSVVHLAYDVAALVVAGAIIERRGYRRFPLLLGMGALVIGAVLWFAEPRMRYYGGLSGIAVAAVIYACLHGLREGVAWRRVAALVLAVAVLKLAVELVSGTSLLIDAAADDFVPVPLAHAAGAIVALTVYLVRPRQPAPK